MQLIRNITKSELFKNVLTLSTGTVIAQIIPVALQLILRRIFEPEIFGAFAVYLSIFGIVSIIYTLRYEFAIINPKSDNDAYALLYLITLISVFWLILSYLIIYFFKNEIILYLEFPLKYYNWLYFIPVASASFAIYQGIQYWLVRKKKFKSVSVNKISRRFSEGTLQLILGLSAKKTGLVFGHFLGLLANIISGIIQIKRTKFVPGKIKISSLLRLMKVYKNYAINTLPTILGTVALLLPVIVVNKFYNENITGQYDLTRTVLATPAVFLAISISQVYLQRISEKFNNKKSIFKDMLYIFGILLILSLSGSLFIIFWGEEILSFLFGNKWTQAGQFAELLIYKYALEFVISPLSIVFIALNRITINSIWQIIYFVLICGILFFDFMEISQFFKYYIFLEVVAYSIYLVLIVRTIYKYETSI